MIILSVNNLSKNYGTVQALRDVSFQVPEGVTFGILGPNGSGKTTLLATIIDIIRPTSGSYKLFDNQPDRDARRRIGTLLETPNFYHYLNAEENLLIAASIKNKGKDDIEKVLRIVNLYDRRLHKFRTYSLGMKQRLAIASCLLGDPEVLIFDEPTNGLDPAGIAEIRQLMRDLHKKGKTIIMASHLLDEVEKVCTHVAILKKGNLITSGDVRHILTNDDVIEISSSDMDRLSKIMRTYEGAIRIETGDSFLQIYFPPGTANPETINSFCHQQGVVLSHLVMKQRSLESKFIELTNNN